MSKVIVEAGGTWGESPKASELSAALQLRYCAFPSGFRCYHYQFIPNGNACFLFQSMADEVDENTKATSFKSSLCPLISPKPVVRCDNMTIPSIKRAILLNKLTRWEVLCENAESSAEIELMKRQFPGKHR